MATFSRFEDIIAWQKARVLCKLIHGFTLKEPFYRDFKLLNSNDINQVHPEYPKLGTRNSKPGTQNSEPGTQNSKPETRNPELL